MGEKRDDVADVATGEFSAYPVGGGAPTAATFSVSDFSSTTSSQESSSTSTNTKTTESLTTFTTTTASSSPSSTSNFGFFELHNGRNVYSLQEDHFLAADFETICPSQNCQKECLNLTRIFTTSADDLGESSDGDPNDIPVTLFGICSNLANATNSASLSGDSDVQSFFPNTLTELDTGVDFITSNLTTCLATTCDMTRKPEECVDYCRPEYLLQSPTLFEFNPGMFQCADRLCSNTCGLPYADQDVFGVGVGNPFLFPPKDFPACGEFEGSLGVGLDIILHPGYTTLLTSRGCARICRGANMAAGAKTYGHWR